MLFTTPEFGILLAALLALLLLFRNTGVRKLLLLTASYVFYMAWNPAFILLILASTITDYFVGRWIIATGDVRRRRGLLVLSLAVNLGMLCWFKYGGYLVNGLLYFFREGGDSVASPFWQITLPVGISFFVFRGLSYSIDVYRGRIKEAATPLDYALYLAFFPQLLAGPIVRAAEFLPQLAGRITVSAQPWFLVLITGGFVKKVVVADNLAPFTAGVFADPESYGSLSIILAAVCFATQIYCDFSGYSDIAIGISGILGFTTPLNFDRPYFAINPVEFWRRWHITLSFWLRDYIFLPLANRWAYLFRRRFSRKLSVLWGAQAALFVTFIICGMWHGAGWNFILWGAWHGLLLVGYRLAADRFAKARGRRAFATGRLGRLLGWALCQYLILAGWIMFKVGDPSALIVALKRFLIFDGARALNAPSGVHVLLVLGITFAFWMAHLVAYRTGFRESFAERPVGWALGYLAICTVILIFFWPTESAPFIYFQF